MSRRLSTIAPRRLPLLGRCHGAKTSWETGLRNYATANLPPLEQGDPFPILRSLHERVKKEGPITTSNLKYAKFKNGRFSSIYPSVKVPDNMDIATFMFDYTSRNANPNQTWYIDENGRQISAIEVKQQVDVLASVLYHRYGVREDDVIVLSSTNSIHYGTVCWAAFRLGAIVAVFNPAYTAAEVSTQLRAIKQKYIIKVLVVCEDSKRSVAEAAEKGGITGILAISMDGDSKDTISHLLQSQAITKAISSLQFKAGQAKEKVAFLCLSSGTTGLPKIVVTTHYNVICNILQFAECYKNGRVAPGESVSLACLPFFHIYGLIVVLHFNLYASVPLVVMPKFNLHRFLELISRHKVTHLWLVPPMAVLLSKYAAVRKHDLSSVQHCMIGAAPINQATIQKLGQVFTNCDIGQETCVVIASYPGRQSSPFPGGSAGTLNSLVSVKIGDSLGIGEPGAIYSQSPSNAIAYLDDTEATKNTWTGDGFCNTGDVGFVDEQGCLHIIDRTKELIKCKGMQVAPAELEDILMALPEVDDACVVPLPHDQDGQVPIAFVVLSSVARNAISSGESDEASLKTQFSDKVAKVTVSYKHLRDVRFIEQIPRNASGKVLRRALRELL